MSTHAEVSSFLADFKSKMSVFGVLFRDERGKNAQTLADLEIVPSVREIILKELKVSDYCDGPIEDKLYHVSEMWVFGKEFKSQQIYIKISLGINGSQVICISFHIAEQELNYPLG